MIKLTKFIPLAVFALLFSACDKAGSGDTKESGFELLNQATWQEVTANSQLTSGDRLIFVYGSSAATHLVEDFMGTQSITLGASTNTDQSIAQFLLGGSAGEWTLKEYSGYYLNGGEKLNYAVTHAKWNINIANSVASITNNGKSIYYKGSESKFILSDADSNIRLFKSVTESDPVLQSLVLTTTSVKKTYTVGEEFDATGLVVKAHYNKGADVTLSEGQYSVSSPDMSTAGQKTITVTYLGVSNTFTITVNEVPPVLQSIILDITNVKLNYATGDTFSTAGLIVKAHYDKGADVTLNSNQYLVSNPDMTTGGVKTITVSYLTVSETFNITVTQRVLQSISLNTDNVQKAFEQEDAFNSTGLVVTAHYNVGSDVTLTSSQYSVSTPDMDTQGNKTVTVTYQDQSETYEISVGPKTPPVLQSLILTTTSVQKDYVIGEEFSTAGLVVKAHYNKGEDVTLTAEQYSISTPDMNVIGEQTITVTYETVSATYKINISKGVYTDKLTRSETGVTVTSYRDWTYTAASGVNYLGCTAGGNGAIQLRSRNSDSGIVTTTSVGNLVSVEVKWNSNTDNGKVLNVYGKNTAYEYADDGYDSKYAGTKIGTITKGTSTKLTVSGSYAYVCVCSNSGAIYLDSITFTWEKPIPVNPTGISIPETAEIAAGKSKTLAVTYTPDNANQNKEITWTSSNTSIATVSNGKVTIAENATLGATATITAQLTKFPATAAATCTVTVVEQQLAKRTIMLYVCGADLESDDGCATDDLQEILAVPNQPEEVNIVVETGGAKSWNSALGISASELGRWHVENQQLVKDDALPKASMGDASTLQEFIEWTIDEYPAQDYGLFLWNHGGSMDGCCFDELFDNDSLSNYEVKQAVSAARSSRNITDKFDFVAYDACLMAVQDIAEYNAVNFDYMLCSQESEWAGGYDYDAWLPTLYADPEVATPTLLKSIADTFIAEQNSQRHYDQTQSVLDLSYMADYLSAWEDMSTSLASLVTKNTWSTFADVVNTAMKYGKEEDSEYSDYNNGYVFDIFDVKGALTALKSNSNYSSVASKIQAVLDQLELVVNYEIHGSQMSGSNGLCFFCPISGYNLYEEYENEDGDIYSANYAAEDTSFTIWRNFIVGCGSWYGQD